MEGDTTQQSDIQGMDGKSGDDKGTDNGTGAGTDTTKVQSTGRVKRGETDNTTTE